MKISVLSHAFCQDTTRQDEKKFMIMSLGLCGACDGTDHYILYWVKRKTFFSHLNRDIIFHLDQ